MPDPNPIIAYGNDLTAPVLQTGWTFETDGFGLIQSQCKFVWNLGQCQANFPGEEFSRGAPHPLSSGGGGGGSSRFANLKLWKSSYTTGKNGTAVVTADYIGVDSEYPGVTGSEGVYMTLPQCSVSGSCSTEDIAHHPNFQKINTYSGGLGTGGPLAGYPPPNGTGWQPDPTKDGYNYNLPLWAPQVNNLGATKIWDFVGFMPVQASPNEGSRSVNVKAGVKSYYRGMPSIKTTVYIAGYTEASALAKAMNLVSLTGWVTDGTPWNLPENIRKLALAGFYDGNFVYEEEWEGKIYRDFLVTNVGVEQYGKTFKVVTDFAISGIAGWDKDIYPKYGSA